MNRRLALLLLAAAATGLIWWTHSRSNFERPAAVPAAAAPSSALRDVRGAAANAGGPYSGEEPSRLADRLNSPDGNISSDLRILNDIFAQYRGATRGGDPVGENAEITAALTGRNRLGFAFIPRSHPAINARGELCDRWGTPFFFHQLSGAQMEIRSAGPDRKMWTPDDQVLTPGLTLPHI